MAKLPFEFIDFKEETFSDYVSRYDIELSNFLSEFEDNTEALFVDYEINNFTYHKDELSEFIKNIDLSSESREEYLQFLKNRVQYFNDKNDNEIELFESDKHKEYSFYYNFLKNRRASVFKILEFLESKKEPITFDKKENENISKSASNDNKKDITSMPWFIVGLNIANGEIHKLRNENKGWENIAIAIGTKKTNHTHISLSYGMIPSKGERNPLNVFDYDYKIKFIHDYCINKGIPMTPEFEKIAEKYL